MKIAHVSAVFLEGGGGTGKACYNTVKSLQKLSNIEITVFVPSAQKQSRKIEKEVNIEYIKPVFSWGNAALVPSLFNKLKDYDLVHLHYPFYGGAEYVLKAAKKYKIPYVITYHVETTFNSLILNTILNLYNAIYLRPIFNNANRIIGVTRGHIHNSLIKAFVNQNKIAIIPNGIDSLFFECPLNNPRNKHLNKTIGFCAVLDKAHYYKGLEYLIDFLAKNRNGYRLLIAGDGNLAGKYKKIVLEKRLNNQCLFLGNLKGKELVKFYDEIDLFVSPSTIPESFLITNIEALSRGKKVITSGWPATKELAKMFNRDFYVTIEPTSTDINKAILSVSSSPRNELFKQIEIVKDNFNWDSISLKVKKLYSEILS